MDDRAMTGVSCHPVIACRSWRSLFPMQPAFQPTQLITLHDDSLLKFRPWVFRPQIIRLWMITEKGRRKHMKGHAIKKIPFKIGDVTVCCPNIVSQTINIFQVLAIIKS